MTFNIRNNKICADYQSPLLHTVSHSLTFNLKLAWQHAFLETPSFTGLHQRHLPHSIK